METMDDRRRKFLAYFAGIGLGSTLLPGVLWGQVQTAPTPEVTLDMLKQALAMSGLSFSEDDEKAMVQSANQSLNRYREVRKLQIPSNISPPYHFSALTPGMKVKRTREPLHFSRPIVKRPADRNRSHSGPSPNCPN
jgi:hypothetical protein